MSFLYVDNKILNLWAESYSSQFWIERLLTGEPESSKTFHEKLKKKEGYDHYNWVSILLLPWPWKKSHCSFVWDFSFIYNMD